MEARHRNRVLAWQERMETERGKPTYKHRVSMAECFKAPARERHGVQRFKVQGVTEVTCLALLVRRRRITHNLLRWAALTG